MRTVFMFLILGALHCTVLSFPPSPINVIFTSVNLRNVLKWLPGNGTSDDIHFTVQYAIYGDSVKGSKGRRVHWRAVRHCTQVVRSWCDLTNETWDLEQGYYAKVRAVGMRATSKWALTPRRFDPKLDTTFGPPLVTVEIEDNSAIISLKGPMRYLPNNRTPGVSMATLYPQMTYNLSIHNTHSGQMRHFPMVSSLYKYRLMEYDTEYCFSAKTHFLAMPVHCQSSSWHCITTPQDPVIGQLQRVVVGIVVPFVCMCMLFVVGYLLYHYLTGKGQTSPNILDPPSFHPPPLTFPPENPKVILITVIKDELPSVINSALSKHACPNKHQLHVADPPPGYAPRWFQTPPEPEELLDDLSVEYGVVCIAPKTADGGEGEGRDWKHNKEDENNLRGKREVDREREDSECSGLCVNKNPQTGLFQIPLNLATKWEGGMKGRTERKIDEGVGEEGKSENIPLLYASQNIKHMPTFHTDQSHFLSKDYSVLKLASAQEEEKATICIDWDPETGKLVLPQVEMAFNKEGGLDGLLQGERGREVRVGDEEEVNTMKDELRLENVFVRQASEEEAQSGVETAWEADDIMTKWNLVISMDQ
ncbi:hypothetical protein PAMP_014318 [Pampus punctatissimus]